VCVSSNEPGATRIETIRAPSKCFVTITEVWTVERLLVELYGTDP
jgi:hypothetical protein